MPIKTFEILWSKNEDDFERSWVVSGNSKEHVIELFRSGKLLDEGDDEKFVFANAIIHQIRDF
jgi:hypothetical protein